LVVIFVAAEVGIFVLYGRSLVTRLVLRPLSRVMDAADAVADGDLEARAPDADTRDFATLAERLNRMTDRLLDAQSQLVRSEKLASIGRLAAGVAHEVGNPLSAIGTYMEVLRRRGRDQEVTEGMARELDRVDRIVRSRLDHYRRAALGVRAWPVAHQARQRSQLCRVPPCGRTAARTGRVRRGTAGCTAVRRRLGPRGCTRRPRESFRAVLHDQGTRPRQ